MSKELQKGRIPGKRRTEIVNYFKTHTIHQAVAKFGVSAKTVYKLYREMVGQPSMKKYIYRIIK